MIRLSWVTIRLVQLSSRDNWAQKLNDGLARPLVQGGGRLIGEDQLGLVDERTSDGDPLPLPPGQLLGFVADALGQPEPAEQLYRLCVNVATHWLELLGHAHVLKGRERFEQVVPLENEADHLPHPDPLLLSHAHQRAVTLPGDVPDFDVALLEGTEAADQREHGCLAAAGRATHDNELTRLQGQVVVEQHLGAGFPGPVIVVDGADTEQRLAFRRHLHSKHLRGVYLLCLAECEKR
jgi:hypothetical protein